MPAQAEDASAAGVSATSTKARPTTRVAVIARGLSEDEVSAFIERLVKGWPPLTVVQCAVVTGELVTGLGLMLAPEAGKCGAGCVEGVLVLGPRAELRSIAPRITLMCEEAGVGVLAVTFGSGGPLPIGPSQYAVEMHAEDAGAIDVAAARGALWALCGLRSALAAGASELRLEAQVRGIASKQLDEHEIEQHLAAMVQREFLPRGLPSAPGVELGALFRPKAVLSGDFYDAKRLDEHHTAFFLADACGHGVPAALLMMLMSKLLPMKEINGNAYRVIEPGEAMTRLNAAFAERKGEVSALVSAVYGVIDSRDGRVRFASAGHPAAIVLSDEARACREYTDAGPLLGTLDDFEYTQVEFVLAPGEVLVVHSDGLPPALGLEERDSALASPLLQGLVEGARAIGMAETALMLGVGLDARSGSLHQHDDITAVMVRRVG